MTAFRIASLVEWCARVRTLRIFFGIASRLVGCALVRTIACMLAITASTAAMAQAPAQPVAAPAPTVMPAAPAVGGLLQTTLALVFVLALLAGLAWFLKRYGPRAGGANANLRVVASLSLGGRERIMVVEVGDQWIVVGASPGRVNALATMPRQEGVEPVAVLSAHLPPASGFADWLKQTIDKRNAK
jgi:flagellar protein FliO/FliZ